MAQLWLTYEEVADAFDCGVDEARRAIASCGWTRKRSHDGFIRALLPQDVMQAYIRRVAAQMQPQATRAVGVEGLSIRSSATRLDEGFRQAA